MKEKKDDGRDSEREKQQRGLWASSSRLKIKGAVVGELARDQTPRSPCLVRGMSSKGKRQGEVARLHWMEVAGAGCKEMVVASTE